MTILPVLETNTAAFVQVKANVFAVNASVSRLLRGRIAAAKSTRENVGIRIRLIWFAAGMECVLVMSASVQMTALPVRFARFVRLARHSALNWGLVWNV